MRVRKCRRRTVARAGRVWRDAPRGPFQQQSQSGQRWGHGRLVTSHFPYWHYSALSSLPPWGPAFLPLGRGHFYSPGQMKERGKDAACCGYLWRTGYVNGGADKALPFTPEVGRAGNRYSRVPSPGGLAAVDCAWLPWEKLLAVWEGWVSGSWT